MHKRNKVKVHIMIVSHKYQWKLFLQYFQIKKKKLGAVALSLSRSQTLQKINSFHRISSIRNQLLQHLSERTWGGDTEGGLLGAQWERGGTLEGYWLRRSSRATSHQRTKGKQNHLSQEDASDRSCCRKTPWAFFCSWNFFSFFFLLPLRP